MIAFISHERSLIGLRYNYSFCRYKWISTPSDTGHGLQSFSKYFAVRCNVL
jgi:hypothetical protein